MAAEAAAPAAHRTFPDMVMGGLAGVAQADIRVELLVKVALAPAREELAAAAVLLWEARSLSAQMQS